MGVGKGLEPKGVSEKGRLVMGGHDKQAGREQVKLEPLLMGLEGKGSSQGHNFWV